MTRGDRDPLHNPSHPSTYWSRTNVAEAMPGVLTPLGWTVWGPVCEHACRRAFAATGALPKNQIAAPARAEDRAYSIFYGRIALNVDFLFEMGEWLPGTSGEAVIKNLVDFVPPGLTSRPSRKRYPVVAARMPSTFLSIPHRARRIKRATDGWYAATISTVNRLDLGTAQHTFSAATSRLMANTAPQSIAVMCGYQPVYDQLQRLATTGAGASEAMMAGLLRGYGSHAETALVEDLWSCSRGRLDFQTFLDRHGYHGPEEGALHARVWREAPEPVLRLMDSYRDLPDTRNPVQAQRRQATERVALERELLNALPLAKRARARAVLALAHTYLPLRGVGKTSYLQPLDVARAAARRIGEHLVKNGTIDDVDDIFFLTSDEITGKPPDDARALITERRERWDYYNSLNVPNYWQGNLAPTSTDPPPAGSASGRSEESQRRQITATGASPGIIEGTIRVITDPSNAEFETGEILVAHTTDPSWASIMYLASALVVDIGGIISHAAVIARELGIPCVMGTRDGTQTLRTGDLCRVDGSAGTIEILERR